MFYVLQRADDRYLWGCNCNGGEVWVRSIDLAFRFLSSSAEQAIKKYTGVKMVEVDTEYLLSK